MANVTVHMSKVTKTETEVEGFTFPKILEIAYTKLKNVMLRGQYKDYLYMVTSMAQAEALIEMVEIADCGSTGGFSRGQQDGRTGGIMYADKYHTLYARWIFLAEKYELFKEKNIVLEDLEKVADFYKRPKT
jgi:hypothetical protein